MAKPMKRKTRPNYFQMNVTNFGEDFPARKSPLDIQRDAKNISSYSKHMLMILMKSIVNGNMLKEDKQHMIPLNSTLQ